MKVLKAPQSGSQAGTTASHNRFGQYERNRRAPVQPIGNGRRAFIRAAFGAASNGFSGLTDAEIAAWNAYASAHPITDSLGQSVTLTGHMMYVSINTQLQNIGLALSSTPPSSATVAPLVLTQTFMDVTGRGVVLVTTADATAYCLVAWSQPVSAGVTFMKTFTQLGVIGPAGIGWDAANSYTTQFGNPALNQRIFIRLTPVNAFGVAGTPTIVSTRAVTSSTIVAPTDTSAATGSVTVTWTGGSSYAPYVHLSDTSMYTGTILTKAASAVSPITVTGNPSGKTVAARLTDGSTWGHGGTTVVVM